MNAIKRTFFLCLIMALSVGPLWAGPIPLSPSPVPSAGQSLLTSFVVGGASSININWEVLPTGPALTPNFPGGLYAYEYQIQNNTASSGVDAYSVTIPAAAFPSIVSAGNLPGDDLYNTTGYHPAFNAVNFPILATAQGPLPNQALSNVLTTLDPVDKTVTWTFSPLSPGNQSDTLYFLSTQPPIYGNAVSQDSIPPSPWGSLAPLGGAQPVPVPTGQNIPEPGTFVLMGLAMVGLVAVGRAKR
jgi:hypothetical protein